MPRSAVTSPPQAQLADFIRAEWQTEQPSTVLQAAEAARQRFGDGVAGVLFYGSCLRTGEVDGKVVDFYVLVDSYRAAYSGRVMALANRLLPPNVFYVETEARGITEEEVVRDVLLEAQATKQFVGIDQLGALAVFLCGDQASQITGTSLPVDGGWTAH